MVVVGPAQAEAILPRFLSPRRRVARLPVVALDLEDQVARQVGRARQLDHALEGRLGGVESLEIVIKPPAPRLPEVACRQGVACRVRLHSPLAGQLARKRLEAQIAPPLDHGQRRSLARHAADPVRAHRIAGHLQAQVVGAGKVRHAFDLDRHLAYPPASLPRWTASGRSPDAIRGKIPPGCANTGTPTAYEARLPLEAQPPPSRWARPFPSATTR